MHDITIIVGMILVVPLIKLIYKVFFKLIKLELTIIIYLLPLFLLLLALPILVIVLGDILAFLF